MQVRISAGSYGAGWMNVRYNWGWPTCPIPDVIGTPWYEMTIVQLNSYVLGCYDAAQRLPPAPLSTTVDDAAYNCPGTAEAAEDTAIKPAAPAHDDISVEFEAQLVMARTQLLGGLASIEDPVLRDRAKALTDKPLEDWRSAETAQEFSVLAQDLMKYRLARAAEAYAEPKSGLAQVTSDEPA